MAISIEKIKRDYDTLVKARANWDTQWERIARLLLPHTSNIQTKRADGQAQTEELFDSTGIDALDKLVSTMIGTMVNSSVQWFSLRMRDEDLNLIPEVALWLDETARRIFAALNQSNFSPVIHEAFYDLAAFGTSATFVDELPGRGSQFHGLRYLSIPIGTYVITEDGLGRVNSLIRSVKMSPAAIRDRWGDQALSQPMKDLIRVRPHEPVELLHAVLPDPSVPRMPVVSIYFDPVTEHLVNERRFFEFPFFVGRWLKTSGEIWGRGRGHLALPELVTANRARELKLKQMALSLSPPLEVLDVGVVRTPRLVPSALVVVRQMGSIKPIEVGTNFNHQAIAEQDIKLQIRQIFFTEQILQFAPIAKTPPTATEVIQRMEFLHHLLGPAVGRIQFEILSPMLERVFNIMFRAGALPPPPSALAQGGQIDIVFEGPLARAQRSDELQAINDVLLGIQGLASFDPIVIDNLDTDAMGRDLIRITGTRQRYLRSLDEVDRLRQQRAQQQQLQLEQQLLLSAGKATRDFSAAGQAATANALQ